MDPSIHLPWIYQTVCKHIPYPVNDSFAGTNPGFPFGEVPTPWGDADENTCKNERIGSRGGGRGQCRLLTENSSDNSSHISRAEIPINSMLMD